MTIVLCGEDMDYDLEFFKEHTFYTNHLNSEKLISISKKRAVIYQNKFLRLNTAADTLDLDWSMECVLKSRHKGEGLILCKTEYLQPYPCTVIVVESTVWKAPNTNHSYLGFIPTSLTIPNIQSIPILPTVIETGIDGVLKVAQLANMRISHTELQVPDCQDPEFHQLITLLREPSSQPLCVQIQKYSQQLEVISFKDSKSKLESIAAVLFPILEDFYSKLEKVKPSDSTKEYGDGLESYLIAQHYDRLFHRNLRFEYEQDIGFTRRLVILDLYHYKTEFKELTDDILQKSMELLLEFEESTTPIRKLDVLSVFFNMVSDHLKKHQQNEQSDADGFLSTIIYLIMRYDGLIRTKPSKLIPSIEFCSKLRFPKQIRGQHAYCVVTMQAAVEYINNIDLKALGVPSNVLDLLLQKKKSQQKDRVLHETFVSNEIENAAKAFSKVFWASKSTEAEPAPPASKPISERLQAKFQK